MNNYFGRKRKYWLEFWFEVGESVGQEIALGKIGEEAVRSLNVRIKSLEFIVKVNL